jgi:hypothetical protein
MVMVSETVTVDAAYPSLKKRRSFESFGERWSSELVRSVDATPHERIGLSRQSN